MILALLQVKVDCRGAESRRLGNIYHFALIRDDYSLATFV